MTFINPLFLILAMPCEVRIFVGNEMDGSISFPTVWMYLFVRGHFVPDKIYRHTRREERAIWYPLGTIKKPKTKPLHSINLKRTPKALTTTNH